jgi:hypothetical protein
MRSHSIRGAVGRHGISSRQRRIKRKPPTALEAERIASDMAMNDNSLQKGDIVATDRGLPATRT